ncbi:hypothetical protein LCGC14_1207310 [marine sediment metagenome]|uniref:Uncharacterized protein n=1 Tax=marine sediment metagenome TaxID=412755 RepID=A0A0F9NXE6_9ZZZZ
MTKAPPVVAQLGTEVRAMRNVGLLAEFAFITKPEMRRLREWSGQDNPNFAVGICWPVGRRNQERQCVSFFGQTKG